MKLWSSHIIEFLKNNLTREEQHALEKSALDDSFLFDAWQGYQENPDPRHLTRLNELKHQLNNRHKKSIFLWPKYAPYAAAAAVLFAAAILWLRPSTDILKSDSTSLIIEDTESADLTIGSVEDSEEDDPNTPTTEEDRPPAVSIVEPAHKLNKESAKDKKNTDEQQLTAIIKNKKQTSEKMEQSAAAADHVQVNTELTASPVLSKSSLSNREIVDTTAAALIATSQTDIMLTSDFKIDSNNHTIKLSNTKGSITLDAVAQRSKAKDPSTIDLTKDESMLLINKDLFAPKIGYPNYYRQLYENTKIDQEWLFLHGIKSDAKVNLRFDLDQIGLPIDIEVIQSSGHQEIDNEAIRLIRTSSPWERQDSMLKITFMVNFKGF